VAAARRTASSFSVYWASTNPSALFGATGVLNPEVPWTPHDPTNLSRISRLPHVKNLETQSGVNIFPLQTDGAPAQNVPDFSPGPGNAYGSVDGLYFNQDKVSVLKGRMANPDNPDEFMLSAQEAQYMGLHVGDIERFGIYTNAQIELPDFGSARLVPYRVIRAKLVGIVAFNTSIVEDEADEGNSPDNLFTPALTRPLVHCCVNYSQSGLQVTGGARFVPTVIAEINHAFRKMPPASRPSSRWWSRRQNGLSSPKLSLSPLSAASWAWPAYLSPSSSSGVKSGCGPTNGRCCAPSGRALSRPRLTASPAY
jgi:hypothetical protein